ncbi:MAG: hypothetical protein ACJ777_08945 [Chloroflexota bacterium]
MSTSRHARRPFAPIGVALVALILVAGCGSATSSSSATTSPSSTPAPTSTVVPAATASPASSLTADAIYDSVEEQVVAIRGLKPTKPVARQFIDGSELRTLLTKQFDEDTPPAYLAANERLYKSLGLIPAGSSLRDLSLDLLSGGVAGFYRNDEGKLYVVSKSGAPGANERFYFAHEYDHALQDQNSTIFKDFDGVLDQSDQLLARQAIYEGDASLLMTQWAAANLSQSELLELLAAGMDPQAQQVMATTPAILRDTLTFPYTTGLGYIQNVQSQGGWDAVNELFSKMPVSTEQILHAEKSGEAPIPVSLPADLKAKLGAGWTVPLEDTFGELQLGIWLREGGVPGANATAAAAGWGGDRLAVLEGPDGAWATVMQTVWDSDADAAAFETAATTALEKSPGVAQVLPGAGGKTRWLLIASDAATASKVAGVTGLAG